MGVLGRHIRILRNCEKAEDVQEDELMLDARIYGKSSMPLLGQGIFHQFRSVEPSLAGRGGGDERGLLTRPERYRYGTDSNSIHV